jgi:hypothetical protein
MRSAQNLSSPVGWVDCVPQPSPPVAGHRDGPGLPTGWRCQPPTPEGGWCSGDWARPQFAPRSKSPAHLHISCRWLTCGAVSTCLTLATESGGYAMDGGRFDAIVAAFARHRPLSPARSRRPRRHDLCLASCRLQGSRSGCERHTRGHPRRGPRGSLRSDLCLRIDRAKGRKPQHHHLDLE